MRWVNCATAFQCRLRTSAILNHVHIDVGAYLDNASMLFQQHIRNTVNKYEAVKVYGVLAAKLRKVLNDEEVVVLRTFMTKMSEIFDTTLLGDWFQKNIKYSILQKVEEF